MGYSQSLCVKLRLPSCRRIWKYQLPYLYLFPVDVHRAEHEVHADGVSMALNVDPVFEPLDDARLADAGVADEHDLEQEVIGVVHSPEVYRLARPFHLCSGTTAVGREPSPLKRLAICGYKACECEWMFC